MHRFVTSLFLSVLVLAPDAAEAAVRLKPINYCPVAASYAFKISGAKGEFEGVGSEYRWLASSLPGWKRDEQALISDQHGRAFDLLTISKGRKRQLICFDITSFFGRNG